MAQVTKSSEAKPNIKNEVPSDSYRPYSESVKGLLTDLYQITMTYAYWKTNHTRSRAVFDLFFRKCPFKGEYTIFAGLDEVLRFLNTFSYSTNDLNNLKNTFPDWDPKFWEYLSTIDASQLTVYAHREGSVVFPKVPLLRIEGPLAVCQLVETTLLNLVNYPSLIATNAARIRHTVGNEITLLEFGLRRAQGPDGAISASRYSFIGGFNGTSNVLAGITYNIPIKGTHAHSFVSSFTSLDDLQEDNINIIINPDSDNKIEFNKEIHNNFLNRCIYYRKIMDPTSNTNDGELASFIAYASAFPKGFLALIDTYETLNSGVINFLIVSLALYIDFGYKPIGIRLDSGDLAYLSKEVRKVFIEFSDQFKVPFKKLIIVASNDINEEVLHALNQQKHEINSFGIGTHLVTCKRQPALGCVYKLVQIDGKPRIKVSQEIDKMTIPDKKLVYRLFDKNDAPVLDLMVQQTEMPSFKENNSNDSNNSNNSNSNESKESNDDIDGTINNNNGDYVAENKQALCYHPFSMSKRCIVKPTRVSPLLIKVWDGKLCYNSPSLPEIRKYCREQVLTMRDDYLRLQNATPYKVSVSSKLKYLIQELWDKEVPLVEFK